MILTKGLPCYACRPGRDWADFQGLLARGDVGITIYRYRPPPDDNPTNRLPRETFILYTTRNIYAERPRQMNLQLCEAVMPKCVNYCPRCKEMMQRIEALFNGPSTTRRSDLCELFSCPPCTDIVRKFREFARDTSIREHDSALIHLQRLTAPQDDLEFKIRSIFNKAGLFKTAGGLKDRDGKIIYKDVCFKDEDGSLQDKEGIYKCRRVSFKDVDGSSKDEEGVDKDEGKGKMKFNDENVKDKEEISKDTGKRFKDINESVKDKDGISNNTGNSCKDKDDSVKDREEIRIDRGKVPSGADRLTENLEGKTHGREAKTSKTSNIKDTMGNEKGRHGTQGRQTETETSKTSNLKGTTGKLKEKHDTQGKETEKSKTNNLKETTEKAKGRQDAPAREVETLKTNNLKATTEKAKGRHEAPAREVETLKTNNLKEIPGKAKGRHDTQGREVETSKTNNLKETTGKAKGRHDAPAREASKTNDLKGNAKAKEKQDTQRRNAETSKTNNSKEQTGKAKGTEAGSSKTKENDEINKDVKLRKSIDEGSKATKTKDTNKTAGSNITKEESKLGKRGGIQNNASDSRIMANELAASKSKKGLSSKAKSMVQLGDQKNRSLEISSGLMRMKIEEHMREIQHEKEETGKTRQAQKPTKVERQARTSAEKARQLSFNETLQLFAPRDEESVDRAGDVLECPQYEEGQEVIRGNRVYKISKREAVKQEKVESAIELQPVKSWRPPSRSRPVSVDKTMVQSSASIGDGVLRYSLSEPKYINRGWTLLPKEMIMRKVRVYLMHPARQNYDWLEMNKHRKLLVYSSGEPLATFEENKTRLYYKSGEVALELYRAEDTNGDRVVVYSTGKPAAGLAQPRTVLAVFDYSGNGAVYDHAGQIRLKYSQNEGVVVDRTIGPHTHWQWHNLNDSRLFHTVLIENQPLIKDHAILEYEEEYKKPKELPDEAVMRGIEAQKFIEETKKSLKKYVPFQIKMKAVKINEHFSLKIFEQPSIFLSFSDGKTRIKINVGMVLDPSVVVGEDLVAIEEAPGGMEGKLAYSESVERLQRVVQEARAVERARVQRERRLNGTPSYLFQKHQKQRF